MRFFRNQVLWIVLVLGTLASFAAYFSLAHLEREAIRNEFKRRSQVIANVIGNSLKTHESSLHALRNLFHYSEEVSRGEFDGAAADLIKSTTGVLSLEWVERVPAEQRADRIAAVRAAGFPRFEITERTATRQLIPARPRPDHFPVVYIHPLAGNESALGFDFASGTSWPLLAESARRDRLCTSGRLPLITDDGSLMWGIILHLPVYRLPVPTAPEARWQSLRGFIVGVFRIEEIVEETLNRLPPQGVDVLIVDDDAPRGNNFLHYHSSRRNVVRPQPEAPPTEEEFTGQPYYTFSVLRLPQRSWRLHCRPAPEWLARQRTYQPEFALSAGLIITALLGFYLHSSVRREAVIAGEVRERTLELSRTQQLLEEDIRRRQQAELALQTSEARLQAIIDYSPALIFVKDFDGRYVLGNRAFRRRMLPADAQPIGRTDLELFPQSAGSAFRQKDLEVITSGQPQTFEETVTSPDGSTFVCLTQKFLLRDAAGRPYALCGISTDISASKVTEQERLALQQELLEAKKLEALGVLAGGIAHDFNNILTSVLGHASLIRLRLGPEHFAQQQLEQVEQAARRAADLCAQMLAYAGKGAFVTGPLDLGRLVRDTSALLQVSLHKNTTLALDIVDPLPAILADGTQLRQIVMNLVLNAADAIGPRPGGSIALRVSTVEATAEELLDAVQRPELAAGRYVALEVRDNGCGMNAETLARIFEPFFTTKFSGRGLGLAATLGVVQTHRGALFVSSREGEGTHFRLLFPVVDAAVPAVDAAAVEDRRTLQGTVLLVDDEAVVREVAELVLQRLKLQVLIASSGEQALELCAQRGAEIDLILLDLTMPGLSGQETLLRLQQLKLRARVLIMSGYSEKETMASCSALGAVGFLHKPFDLDQLFQVLRRFLA